MDTRQRRPDLEALPVAQRPGFLSGRIFPMLPKMMRQGTQYFQGVKADHAAQTGRTGGTAPTSYLVSDEKVAFNLENDEFIDREEIPDDEIAGLGHGGMDGDSRVGGHPNDRRCEGDGVRR